jgi:hypothetical protein
MEHLFNFNKKSSSKSAEKSSSSSSKKSSARASAATRTTSSKKNSASAAEARISSPKQVSSSTKVSSPKQVSSSTKVSSPKQVSTSTKVSSPKQVSARRLSSHTEKTHNTPLLVVFDIDETLIQYVNSTKKQNPINHPDENKKYNNIIEDAKRVFGPENCIEEGGESSPRCIILRPHIRELFNYLKHGYNNGTIRVGLWTYSERDYANHVARTLSDLIDLPRDFFVFKFGEEDMDESSRGVPKDLSKIWELYPQFNTFNTILVDDRDANLYHKINRLNCVFIQPFAPYGVEKIRSISPGKSLKNSHDNVFVVLQEICDKIVNYIKGCTAEEVSEAFAVEPVFLEKKVNKMGLRSRFKTYNLVSEGEEVQMMTIGHPHISDEDEFAMAGGYRRRKKYSKKTKPYNRRTRKMKRR